jgi:hypothetical protein
VDAVLSRGWEQVERKGGVARSSCGAGVGGLDGARRCGGAHGLSRGRAWWRSDAFGGLELSIPGQIPQHGGGPARSAISDEAKEGAEGRERAMPSPLRAQWTFWGRLPGRYTSRSQETNGFQLALLTDRIFLFSLIGKEDIRMKRVYLLTGALTLVFFAFASSGSARTVAVSTMLPHCGDVAGCVTVGYDLGSKQCLYNCG